MIHLWVTVWIMKEVTKWNSQDNFFIPCFVWLNLPNLQCHHIPYWENLRPRYFGYVLLPFLDPSRHGISVKHCWFGQFGSTVHHLYIWVSFESSLLLVLLAAIQMCFYLQKYQHRSANVARRVSTVFHGGWHHICRTLLVHKVRMVIKAVLNSCVGLRKRRRLPSVPYVSMGQTGRKLQRRLALIKLSTSARTFTSTIARSLDWTAWCKNITRYSLVA